ncbi:MAG: hypothetical protein ACPHUJ_07680 [Pseudomonadales bacterium]
MLYYLGQWLADWAGPMRLLGSNIFLAGAGTAMGALSVWWLLPRYWRLLPSDQGREYAVGAAQSIGKPMSAGVLFIPVFVVIAFLFVPYHPKVTGLLACALAAMMIGYFDDRAVGGWSEYRLGALDLLVSICAAWFLCGGEPVSIWLPLYKEVLVVPVWLYMTGATPLLWVSINATNCTDGVDGLSASLTSMAILFLGGILYGIVGHAEIAQYLLVPHYVDGAQWAILAFVMVGTLTGYLWHNSYPSAVLMGDSGSRPVGLILGALALASGNPFLILVVAFVILVNGATGMVKVVLMRFFNIPIFKNIRYPLHDHVRHNMGWSNTQVLVRFMLLQAVGTPILLVLLLKIR